VLNHNTTGNNNTAAGYAALNQNTTGSDNTAIGSHALFRNTGAGNLAIGSGTLDSNTSGSFNVAINGGRNLTDGIFNVDIANDGVAGESNTTRIGILQNRCFISGIFGVTPSGITPVYVNSDGQLGTAVSSARFKDEIKPIGAASEAILALRPVSFRYKKAIDPQGVPQFGLVAEEVEKVNPDLIVRDKEGRPQTVRYEQINAMLLNEFLKEHRKVQEQEATITQLKQDFQSKLAEQQNQIEALISGLEKVGNQLELSKSAPQIVRNNR
jgi:hypothetical protein